MKRHNDENPAAPSTKKYKSRWDVGPNDVENEVLFLGVYPKSDIERQKIQPNSDIERKRIQPKTDIEQEVTQPKSDIEKKRIQPKNDAQQKHKNHCGQVHILLFFPNAMLTLHFYI